MSHPDPYQPQQQPPPGPYPPAPPGAQGYSYPPAQPYGAQPQTPYYPPPVPPQPAGKRDDGNSRVWRILDNLMFFASDSNSQGLGNNARDRVKTALMIFGITFLAIAILIAIAVVMSK
ncbi:hypothetical protein [Mycolicibacterium porcinum]|uniref:Uncharacterized protein n=1 Tax=Mycolicibacterium porcinum TaxID=39693 RepID=A0ABV3VPL8_9MYCO|nr:hypothetical protein [Mycobacterium sp. 20091114027_K0903767]